MGKISIGSRIARFERNFERALVGVPGRVIRAVMRAWEARESRKEREAWRGAWESREAWEFWEAEERTRVKAQEAKEREGWKAEEISEAKAVRNHHQPLQRDPIENQYLSGLLHYDPSNKKKHADLQKGLEAYKFLLSVSSTAISLLQNRDLEKFDSLVGENACQIRAIKIALIASKKLDSFNDLSQRVSKTLEKVHEVLSTFQSNAHVQQRLSLVDLIDQYKLDVLLVPEESFLIQSYILTEMKEIKYATECMASVLINEKCCPEMLQKKYPQISCAFLEKTAKKMRRLLSISSVQFVRQVASELQDPSLIKMVAKDFEREHNKLTCIPTFWSFKALFTLAQQKRIPLVIHAKFLGAVEEGYRVVDEEFLYFKVCQRARSYLKIEPNEEELILPACIIQGVVCPREGGPFPKQEWRESIARTSIIDMLLAIGANHRQYPDPNQSISIEDGEYEYYKNLADTMGFSLNNPITFFAQHIYCSQAIRVMPRYANSLVKAT